MKTPSGTMSNWQEIQERLGKMTRAEYKQLKGRSYIEKQYYLLRAEAEAWSHARADYMTRLLSAGRHPDTDPHFWDGFEEPRMPLLARAKADPRRDLLVEFDGERPKNGTTPPSAK